MDTSNDDVTVHCPPRLFPIKFYCAESTCATWRRAASTATARTRRRTRRRRRGPPAAAARARTARVAPGGRTGAQVTRSQTFVDLEGIKRRMIGVIGRKITYLFYAKCLILCRILNALMTTFKKCP